MEGFTHLQFKKQWKLTENCIFELGQCDAIIKSISKMPLQPDYHRMLLNVSLKKGAQATTAIEGNTLTSEEIEKIIQGNSLPPSKEYQQIEVKNILDAYNQLLEEVVAGDKEEIVTDVLIKRFHKIVGQNLGDHFQAIPGKFRKTQVVVGSYRCPNYEYVPELINKFCQWIGDEFHYSKGQSFKDVIIQAIVCHVYIAWIHPFGDGNGRTARLLEFYLLLRAGNPDISLHILSNFYNDTRNEYYRLLDQSAKKNDLSEFIEYAVKGFRDGLLGTLEIIQKNILEISWKKYIYDKFSEVKFLKKDVHKRKRNLALNIPFDKILTIDEIIFSNPAIAKSYFNVTERTIDRDLEELVKMKILVKKRKLYMANIDILSLPQMRENNRIK